MMWRSKIEAELKLKIPRSKKWVPKNIKIQRPGRINQDTKNWVGKSKNWGLKK